MLITHKNSRDSRYLSLGIQTNPGCEFLKMLWLADQWSSKQAKSFSILSYTETTYSGLPVALHEGPIGYASFKVAYYTTSKEGNFPVGEFSHYPYLERKRSEEYLKNRRAYSVREYQIIPHTNQLPGESSHTNQDN